MLSVALSYSNYISVCNVLHYLHLISVFCCNFSRSTVAVEKFLCQAAVDYFSRKKMLK